MTIRPETKDWTWVLQRACPECGFDPGSVTRANLADRIREVIPVLQHSLQAPDVDERPDEQTWSKLEYVAHVRDAATVMGARMALICSRDGASFENWDQDATAVAEGYHEQDPTVVSAQVETELARLADSVEAIEESAWENTATRSNGSKFSTFTLGVYALHDFEHHAWDVTGPSN